MRAAAVQTYAEKVDQWVLAAIQDGALTLDEIVCAVPGVYPTDVVESLTRIPTNDAVAIRRGALTQSIPERGDWTAAPKLPVPHPLDFDWRFTTNSSQNLARLGRYFGSRLLCMGTPSLFLCAKEAGDYQSVNLVDRNAEITGFLRRRYGDCVLRHDLLVDPIPNLLADVVVMDPPWYCEHFRGFLWTASRLISIGSHVIVCVPSRGTRPNVDDELRILRDWTDQLGFEVLQEREDAITYVTPPFEQNALRAAGVDMRGAVWRKGSVWILEKRSEPHASRPSIVTEPSEDWLQATLFGTRFFFKNTEGPRYSAPSLRRLIEGDVLPSVSRRHHLRDHVEVWSSGNRVFACKAAHILHRVVVALANGQDPVQYVENDLNITMSLADRKAVLVAAKFLWRLAMSEHRERQSLAFGRGRRC